MCEFCTDAAKARKRAKFVADELRNLANRYEDMADPRYKPHTEAAKATGSAARLIVRELVEDWV